MGRRFLALVVTPGVDCKVSMPPCSALEIKHAALANGKVPPGTRCTLECDLATQSFVLCSLPAGGPKQAKIGTVVTNDPDEPAWFFLKATGPIAFHDEPNEPGANGEQGRHVIWQVVLMRRRIQK